MTPAEAMMVHLAIFPDRFATSKTERDLNLDQLRLSAQTTNARTKDGLPLIKLASFGDKRTAKNSLRSNENLVRARRQLR